MTTSMLAFGKASAFGALKRTSVTWTRQSSSSSSSTTAAASGPSFSNDGNGQPPSRLLDEYASQRELFMDVLSANATKRDAKQYLARFRPAKGTEGVTARIQGIQAERNARHRHDQDRLERMGVNLGGLYAPSRAIADSPQFQREEQPEKATAPQQRLHVALVCLRAPDLLDDATLEGLAITLSQLVKLDMRIVLVLELAKESRDMCIRDRRATFAEQAERLLHVLRKHSRQASRFVAAALEVEESRGEVGLNVPDLLMEPLKRRIIPIVPSLAYTPTGKLVKVETRETMAALTRYLALGGSAKVGKESNTATSLDRLIVLDHAGGIPSKDRSDNAHVFINLDQEYDDIREELSSYAAWDDGVQRPNIYDQHQDNLDVMNTCLRLLPSASSGLIISPQEAATSSQNSRAMESIGGAGTRRQKNTLIHNILTNKPMVSSSLPTARLSSTNGAPTASASAPVAAATATLVKKGMPLTIIPAADRRTGWTPPPSGTTTLDLRNDPRIDFPRLVHLIEDSFRRKLDVEHYLSRIHGRVAGLIVAGNYEGGAILTWEASPCQSTDRTAQSDPGRLVPYLDKFAVLQSSQGSSGVADILFQAMVRSCFPRGVCWRSRKDNPVNKWYFERAAGSWQIPSTNWTMFWTGKGVVEDELRWDDYVSVCREVAPSWADGKVPD